MTSESVSLPFRTRAAMFLRLFAIQGSWNYETLIGNGIAFCIEPALRFLPGGKDGPAYRAALARQGQYFNAHPYLAAVAVGALARAELDGEEPARIERFRTALCGPLGSVGDSLVWAAWLPFCSVIALAAFALGAGPVATVAGFLLLYNSGHVWLRAWGLAIGWREGLRVAPSLGSALLRRSPQAIRSLGAVVGGGSVPLVFQRIADPGPAALGIGVALALAAAATLARLQGRVEGWKAALTVLALVAVYSTVRS
ncbi:MAG: PTS system mannose/fructose/sorbose family transporter subunit IID [Gemmatimonadaceae bacterium]